MWPLCLSWLWGTTYWLTRGATAFRNDCAVAARLQSVECGNEVEVNRNHTHISSKLHGQVGNFFLGGFQLSLQLADLLRRKRWTAAGLPNSSTNKAISTGAINYKMAKDDKKTNRQTKNVCNRTVKTTHKTAFFFVTKNFHAVRILWVLKNKTLAGDVDGEKQNETGYELSRGTFVVTDFTRHNLMDGSVSAGNDLEMIQITGTMWAEEESRRICLTSPCILSSFLRRHGIKKQWTEIEENINCKGSYKSIFSAFRILFSSCSHFFFLIELPDTNIQQQWLFVLTDE